jgi:tryptophan synthase beta subunit
MTATRSDLVRNAHLREECEEALQAVEAALHAEGPVPEMEEADELERKVVRLRDTLIELLRHDLGGTERHSLRTALDRVNAALSVVAGVEYPSKGPQRELLLEAKKGLRPLLRRRSFQPD